MRWSDISSSNLFEQGIDGKSKNLNNKLSNLSGHSQFLADVETFRKLMIIMAPSQRHSGLDDLCEAR